MAQVAEPSHAQSNAPRQQSPTPFEAKGLLEDEQWSGVRASRHEANAMQKREIKLRT